MASLPQIKNPNVLVGFETNDDAGVYKLNSEQAIVNTADFITPPVDDPYLFGQIAAANALSDIYAMGGKPFTCLSLVGFPSNKLGPEILHGIITGAMNKINEAGAVLIGGHTTEDQEPKFGLSVTGIVHPDKIWKNSGSQAGDCLILTKPIGSGVLFNANLKNWVSNQAMDECLKTLIILNKKAAEIMAFYEINGATDITGFGLAGHALEMAKGSGVTLEIDLDSIPVMKQALEVYERGMSTGVNASNRRLTEADIHFTRNIPKWNQEIIMDPQTSGGLMVSIKKNQANDLLAKLHQAGINDAKIIGKVAAKKDKFLIFK